MIRHLIGMHTLVVATGAERVLGIAVRANDTCICIEQCQTIAALLTRKDTVRCRCTRVEALVGREAWVAKDGYASDCVMLASSPVSHLSDLDSIPVRPWGEHLLYCFRSSPIGSGLSTPPASTSVITFPPWL